MGTRSFITYYLHHFVSSSSCLGVGSTVNLPIKYYATDQEVAEGYGSKESYLPFKLNPTGMQPLIMAQCVLQAPTLFANMFRNSFWFGFARFLEQPSVFIPVYFALLFSSAFLDVSETSKEISLWMGKVGFRLGSCHAIHIHSLNLSLAPSSVLLSNKIIISSFVFPNVKSSCSGVLA